MKIICVGRNYRDHVAELNNPVPDNPVLFLKPDSSILKNNEPFFIPDFTNSIHHEVELVLRVCKVGKNIQKQFAHRYYDQIGIGIDFTARDLQQQLKQKGLPWEICKAFDGSAPIGSFFAVSSFHDVHDISFSLLKNGETVQQGNSSQMIFTFDDLIVYISRFFTLKMGDLIFTGTPAGVGPVAINDRLQAFIGSELALDMKVK